MSGVLGAVAAMTLLVACTSADPSRSEGDPTGSSDPGYTETATTDGAAAEEAAIRADTLAGLNAAIAELDAADPATFDLEAALECVPVSTIYYCPLDAWSGEPRTREPEPPADPDLPDGDVSWEEQLAQLHALPPEEQIATVRLSLVDAVEFAGKALREGQWAQPIPPEVLGAF